MKTCICCGCIMGEHYTGGSVLEAIYKSLGKRYNEFKPLS